MRTRVLGVFAHPDDDVFTLGGTLALHAGEIETTLVFVTSGGAGPIADPTLATRSTLADVREREQAAASEALGIAGTTSSRFLRHPDYYVPAVPFERLVAEVADVMQEIAPDVVVTFGPEGITSHHDHVRSGEAATAAFHRARGGASSAGFRRLYHVAVPRSSVDRFYDAMETLDGATYGAEGTLFNITGVPDERIDVRVDTRPVARRKMAAIRAHETQRGEWERIPEPLRWIHLHEECFVRVWPPPTGASAVATDPFDGL